MISSIIKRALKQTAVYWSAPVDDGWGGQTFATPVEISCRWEDKTELIRADNGREMISSAQIHVDQDLDFEGFQNKDRLLNLACHLFWD